MTNIELDIIGVMQFISQDELDNKIKRFAPLIDKIRQSALLDEKKVYGWTKFDEPGNLSIVDEIIKTADEIRDSADVLVLIGIGGSNQGARAVIKSLGDSSPGIIYAGNNLSSSYLSGILKKISGKSVYVNVIAKNFHTLEPGITFRVIREHMEKTYGRDSASKRIIATGTRYADQLFSMSQKNGYRFFDFPPDTGGRYSVLSAVGLLPIAVAGVDITGIIKGAAFMKKHLDACSHNDNPALSYAVIRNMLLSKNYTIEILAHFEPVLTWFSKWWAQLFGESEGKDGKGIFPVSCAYSEDLHSLGQYVQSGRRILFETFLDIIETDSNVPITKDMYSEDGFEYLEGLDFNDLNKTALLATIKAHINGGVPCTRLIIPKLTPYYMGQLFYFFEYSCCLSAFILGVDPFDQPGVEEYKQNMQDILRKNI